MKTLLFYGFVLVIGVRFADALISTAAYNAQREHLLGNTSALIETPEQTQQRWAEHNALMLKGQQELSNLNKQMEKYQ